ncbi:MAG: hypothetical protein IJV38_02900 [Prevotella sp.]|nr:hypothetical protein [Prevotella sp.]
MKKFLLFALVAMLGLPVMAQDEIGDDVTKYVVNAGFDEDLTFQADGTMKAAVTTNTSLSDRSWAYIAEDSTVYARPKSTSGQSRPDGRKLEAVNGFKGRVKGWTLESNAAFPQCEWTYFGTVPYDLKGQAVPIADDGTTYLEVPERPTEFDGGEGFVYLRAGWTNSAIYKQVVKLPCARYRLEYWTININPNTSAVAQDLTQIVCRKDVFKDESGTGLSNQEWTKHEFEFTPTAEFTMQFGYEAANAGSAGQPIVALDGIRLIKIDDADPIEEMLSDLFDLMDEYQELIDETTDYPGLLREMEDESLDLNDMINNGKTEEDLKAAEAAIRAALAKYRQALIDVVTLDELLAKAEQLVMDPESDYPGKEALSNAIDEISTVIDNGGAEDIAAAIVAIQKAIQDYYASQVATREEPADYTFYVKNPWFVAESGEPTKSGDSYVFPHEYDEENPYTVGSAPFDGTSEGWYIGEGGGDQRLNWRQGRTCWNAWNNNFNTVTISQDLEGLPNGLYRVAADLITQSGLATDQHTYAKSSLQEAASEPLRDGLWSDDEEGYWTTLLTENWVIVADGKLTIGATGTGAADTGAAGWFMATNFKLYYYGEATEEEIAAALAEREAYVKGLVSDMHFAGDKAAANALIVKYSLSNELETLNEAAALAETSEAKYNEIMQEGKTIPTVEAGLADNVYGTAAPIAQFALDYVKAYIASADASYEKVDSVLAEAKNYTETYIPVYQEAEELLLSSKSQTVKEILQPRLAAHVNLLTAEMKDAATVAEYVEELKTLIYNVNKQELYESDPDATDYTAFIQNPMAEAETGWTLEYTDGPIKTGQWYTGDASARYFDSWNATAGALTFYGEQVVVGLPNGTYTIGVDVRTSDEGAFVFGAGKEDKSDLKWVEIPLQTYTYVNSEGEEVTENATDKWGQIWEDATERFATMTDNDPDYYDVQAIYNCNDSQGRGWEHLDIEGIVVEDHVLVLGMAVNAGGAPKEFLGTWFSANNWTLTLTAKGDNSGWDGPIASGISELTTTKAIDGIYTVSGMRTGKLQRGLNIVVRDGKAVKVLVK